MKKQSLLSRFLYVSEPLPRHLTQSIALEEARLPGVLRTSVTLVGMLLGGFLVWAAFAKVDEVAATTGSVVPSGYIQSVQHLEGGIVREILVRDGDMVEAGQSLIRLDDTSASADLGQMRARQNALHLQAERLRNFAGMVTENEIPADTSTPQGNIILQSMIEARETQRSVLRDQIAQKEKELQAIISSRNALRQNVELMKTESGIRQDLAQQGYGSKLMALASERELNQMRGQLAELNTQETRAHDAIREAQNRLQSLDADLKQQSLKELSAIEAEMAELENSLGKYEFTANRTTITSPIRGIVKGLSIHTLGAVVEPGKVLMEIVPVNEELMVESLVEPSDIGHLKPGQPVKVKISAYEYSRYGTLNGQLASVSASTFQNEEGQSFYKARVKLPQAYVGSNPEQNLILPGMTVQADIITGDKTILQYLLNPIHKAVEGAFHER